MSLSSSFLIVIVILIFLIVIVVIIPHRHRHRHHLSSFLFLIVIGVPVCVAATLELPPVHSALWGAFVVFRTTTMSSPSKEDTFVKELERDKKGLVEFRLKGYICKWLIPASINLKHLSKEFCLEYDDLRPFAVWVPSDQADHFFEMMNDELQKTEPGRSRLQRFRGSAMLEDGMQYGKTKKGVVLLGPQSGGEDEDNDDVDIE